MRDAGGQAQFDCFLRQQSDSPAPPTLRRSRTGQRDQPRLKSPIKSNWARWLFRSSALQGGINPLFHEAFLQVFYGARCYSHGLGRIRHSPGKPLRARVTQE